jgi:NADPH:quinone reductase
MRQVRFHTYGGPEVLRVDDVPSPEPGPGEVLLEVTGVGVTLPVVRQTHGDGAGGGVALPYAPAGEVVGQVLATGPGVTGWEVGARGAGLAFSGAYAERATVKAGMLAPVPDDIADGTALVLVRSGQVALGALAASGFSKGESVLVTAAAGGVGHVAVQLAVALGASRVVAAVSSEAKAGFVRELGADDVVVYGEPGAEWGEPVDVVLDGAGGEVFGPALGALAMFGRLVAFNGVGGPVDANELRMRGIAVIGFAMPHLVAHRREVYDRHQQELWDLARGGRIATQADGPLRWRRPRGPIASSRTGRTWAR